MGTCPIQTISEPDFISSAGLRRVTLADARVRPTLDFVLPGLLSGTTGLLVSPGGTGKTMLALAIGLAVASGRTVCHGLWPAGPRGPVTVIAGEDPPEVLQERLYHLRISEGLTEEDDALLDEGQLTVLSAAGANDLRILTTGGNGGVIDGPFRKGLLQICQGQRLVIIDPLLFLSDFDENDNARMGSLIRAINSVAAKTNTAILLLHHTSKGAGEDWAAARGASSLTTSVRWQINLLLPSNGEAEKMGLHDDARFNWVRVAQTKANYGPPVPVRWLRRVQGGILRAIGLGDVPVSSDVPRPNGDSKKGGRTRARAQA